LKGRCRRHRTDLPGPGRRHWASARRACSGLARTEPGRRLTLSTVTLSRWTPVKLQGGRLARADGQCRAPRSTAASHANTSAFRPATGAMIWNPTRQTRVRRARARRGTEMGRGPPYRFGRDRAKVGGKVHRQRVPRRAPPTVNARPSGSSPDTRTSTPLEGRCESPRPIKRAHLLRLARNRRS